jgi:polyisoprenoid-binding protein YceI
VISLDASQAECLVFTYKEGLLSAVAHDLEIRVGRFTVEIDPAVPSVRARFDARALAVQRVPERDKRTIEGHIADDVLHTKRYPEIAFASKRIERAGDRAEVRGDLTLHGTTREIAATAHKKDGRWTAEVRLHQPDWGIKPFTAMLGTLRIRAHVDVRLTLPEIW